MRRLAWGLILALAGCAPDQPPVLHILFDPAPVGGLEGFALGISLDGFGTITVFAQPGEPLWILHPVTADTLATFLVDRATVSTADPIG